MIFLRIIIPNYNKAEYLTKCLDSIVNQTFQDFKVIIIDDCSTDNSVQIIQSYVNRYPDKVILVQNSENKGAAGSRNIGLEYKIESEYTWFIDSDDYIYNTTVFQTFYDVNKNIHADVYSFLTEVKQYEYMYIKKFGFGYCACKILKSALICKFNPDYYICEDYVQWQFISQHVKSTYHINQIFYHYNKEDTLLKLINQLKTLSSERIKKHYTALEQDIFVNTISNIKLNSCLIQMVKMHVWQSNEYKQKQPLSIADIFKYSFAIVDTDEQFNILKKVFEINKLPIPKQYQNIRFSSLSWNIATTKQKHIQADKLNKIYGCSATHISLVKMAKYLDLPYILIFEDDAYPCYNIIPKLEYILANIPIDCKLLILGHTKIMNDYQYSAKTPLLLKPNKVYGSHAYLLFKDGYDDYLNASRNKTSIADIVFSYIDNRYMTQHPLFAQCNYGIEKDFVTFKASYYNIGIRYFEKVKNYCYDFPPLSKYEKVLNKR